MYCEWGDVLVIVVLLGLFGLFVSCKIVFFFFCFFSFLCCSGSNGVIWNNMVHLDSTHVDLGQVRVGSSSNAVFELTNISNVPIVISSIHQSCNCLEIDWTHSVIEPKQKGTIHIRYASNRNLYPFEKRIGVHFVNTDSTLILTIHGRELFDKQVLRQIFDYKSGALGLMDKDFNIGYVPINSSYQTSFPICNFTDSPIELLCLSNDDSLLVSFDLNPIPPRCIARLLIQYISPNTIGEIVERILISATELERQRSYQSRIILHGAAVMEGKNMSESLPLIAKRKYDIGVVDNIDTCEITIANKGKDDLQILNVSSSAHCVVDDEFLHTIRPNVYTTVRIRFNPTTSIRLNHKEIIAIFTNSRSKPVCYIEIKYKSNIFTSCFFSVRRFIRKLLHLGALSGTDTGTFG